MKIWKEQTFSSQIVEEFLTMINISEEMLSYAFKTLTKKGKGKKVQEKIYNKDQNINVTERYIRKKIYAHIQNNPTCNLPSCLALISVAKDAERLGDYVKDIIELKQYITDTKNDSKLIQKLLDQTGDELLQLFKTVSNAFKDSNIVHAKEAIKSAYEISEKCEKIIIETANSNYTSEQAVVMALGARYIKRIACHLSNIASSIVNPITQLDFFKLVNK